MNLIILLSSFVVFYINKAHSWVGGYSKIPLIWKPQDQTGAGLSDSTNTDLSPNM